MAKSQQILEKKRIRRQQHMRALIRYDENHAMANVDAEGKLWDPLVIPPEKYCPVAAKGTKRALKEIPEHCFVKYSSLKLWDPEQEVLHLDYLKLRFLREVEICERINRNRHYNLATYHGCIVKNGLVRGIVYSTYDTTLDGKVNPDHRFTKQDFRYGFSPLQNRAAFIKGVRNGLKHLHGLGLVHNDIKPDNIMLRPDESPVIIDFDSCTPIWKSLKDVGRTKGWHDPEVDFQCLRMI